MSLLVTGNTVVDIVFPGVKRLPEWPRHTESTPDNLVLLSRAPIMTLGGNGANAAWVAARCGARVELHTRIGPDAAGRLARSWLDEAGCEVRVAGGSRAAGASTAVNVTAANVRHGRATFFHPGQPVAMPSGLATRQEMPSWILVCGFPHPPLPSIARGFRGAIRRGAFTALDTGPILGRPWTLASLRPVLGSLSLLLANEYELGKIAGTANPGEMIRRVRRVFSGHLVVKRGAKGARWIPASSDECFDVPARCVRVVNTIGAGDSFNGALLAALDGGAGFAAAVRTACAVAASVVASPDGVLGMKPP
ncbi:sugar kinase, ribokinase [Opitutaceae bacterium TAV1]|nr:sugar kinase, ribokinase [Opitutaceae bacterium TAV1]